MSEDSNSVWTNEIAAEIPETTDLHSTELERLKLIVVKGTVMKILKDVARSGGHMPDDTSEDVMDNFQKELTQILCWMLSKHPNLNYYQEFNDVAATERFMEKTMERVNQELFYIFALLDREHPKLLDA